MKWFMLMMLSISLLTFNSSVQAQASETKKKLIGSWIYFGLEVNSELAPLSKSDAEKAERMNKGIIITFEPDGQYQVWRRVNGKKEILASGETSLTDKGKHLSIQGLEGEIQTLNKDYLKLFSTEDHPLMVFKKYIE